MLSSATISLANSAAACIGIPVVNFPELPVDSGISLYFDKLGFCIEDVPITSYSADNRRGVTISVDSTFVLLGSEKERGGASSLLMAARAKDLDDKWDLLASACRKDEQNLFSFVYPEIIDFSPAFCEPPI